MAAKKIAVLVGSLRKESITRKMAKALVANAPASLSFEFIDIGALALYNQDLEERGATAPQPWTDFRKQVAACDAVLFFTPEYNRSVPAPLKDAIVSVSPGAIGAFGANHHLRQSLVFLDVPTMQQPEAYLGGAGDLFDDAGNLSNDSTKQFLQKYATAYAAWVETNAAKAKPA